MAAPRGHKLHRAGGRAQHASVTKTSETLARGLGEPPVAAPTRFRFQAEFHTVAASCRSGLNPTSQRRKPHDFDSSTRGSRAVWRGFAHNALI